MIEMVKTGKPWTVQAGGLTYAYIDCPDAVWRWAIVTGYVDNQTYGHVITAFAEGFELDRRLIKAILKELRENMSWSPNGVYILPKGRGDDNDE